MSSEPNTTIDLPNRKVFVVTTVDRYQGRNTCFPTLRIFENKEDADKYSEMINNKGWEYCVSLVREYEIN